MDREPYEHTCGAPGEYLSTACAAARANRDPLVEKALHGECRRSCKWCVTGGQCNCVDCVHEGPVVWELEQVARLRWVIRIGGAGKAWTVPGRMTRAEAFAHIRLLRAMRWLGPNAAVVPVLMVPRWWWRLLEGRHGEPPGEL